MIDPREWKHVFKLDPDKPISDRDLEAICESGSHGIIVGGTYGVTYDNTIDLLSRIRRYAIPCVLEVSNAEAIVPGFDHYFIPLVLNAMNAEWIIQPHVEAIKELGTVIHWEDVSVVGYSVLNPTSAVAQLTQSRTELHSEDVIAYGRLAKHLLKIPYFYLEYSGSMGDEQLVSAVYHTLRNEGGLHLFYGGGIQNAQQARTMKAVSDTIVVGNVIYEDLEAALETVQAVHHVSEG